VEAAAGWERRSRIKKTCPTPLFNSLWPQPYLDIDGGGDCGPVGEEEQNEEDLSYSSLRFSLASTLPEYRRRWRLLPGG
jgi:hypothetical protein